VGGMKNMSNKKSRKIYVAPKSDRGSCRYCSASMGQWKVEEEDEIYYLCDKHKKELQETI
jgi:hypothetical protein